MAASDFEFRHATRESQGDRPYQEDFCVVAPASLPGTAPDEGAVIAVLCDGMGGHVSGEVASRSAAEAFVSAFNAAPETHALSERLNNALAASNGALAKAIEAKPELKGMGCTLVAALVTREGLRWVSVGDSALLLYRNGGLHRLNEDHSLGALLDKQADANVISRQEAEASPRRRTLRSALTGNPLALKEIQSEPVKLKSGDWIIVASDGLETLDGNEIASIVRRSDADGPESLGDRLIEAVLARKARNQDNVSLIPISVSDPSDPHIQPTHWIQRDAIDPNLKRPVGSAGRGQRGGGSWGMALLLFLIAVLGGGYAYYHTYGVPDAIREMIAGDSESKPGVSDAAKSGAAVRQGTVQDKSSNSKSAESADAEKQQPAAGTKGASSEDIEKVPEPRQATSGDGGSEGAENKGDNKSTSQSGGSDEGEPGAAGAGQASGGADSQAAGDKGAAADKTAPGPGQ